MGAKHYKKIKYYVLDCGISNIVTTFKMCLEKTFII